MPMVSTYMLLHATICYFTLPHPSYLVRGEGDRDLLLHFTTHYFTLLHISTHYFPLLLITSHYYIMLLHFTTQYYIMLLNVITQYFTLIPHCTWLEERMIGICYYPQQLYGISVVSVSSHVEGSDS